MEQNGLFIGTLWAQFSGIKYLQYYTVPFVPEWSDGCSNLSSPLLSSTSATVVSSGSLLYSL